MIILVPRPNLLRDEDDVSDLPKPGQERTQVDLHCGYEQEPSLNEHPQPLCLVLLPRHRPVWRGIHCERPGFVCES